MIAGLRLTLKSALETRAPKLLHRARVVRHIYLSRYEQEIAIVGALIRPGTDAVDVGANTGLFSWQISRYARHCYCFEPQPGLVPYLRGALPGNCEVIEAAAGETEGRADLKLPWFGDRFDEGLASLNPEKTAQFDRVKTISVRVAPLDAIVKTPVSFINIDVEGHEIHALRGARAVLTASRPNLLVEIERRHNPSSFGLCTAFFRDLSYSGFFWRERTLKPLDQFDPGRDQDLRAVGTSRYINNFLFLPNEAPLPRFA